jgi:methyl-accepting chemotaxis protein-1 (serine sensor receptor)
VAVFKLAGPALANPAPPPAAASPKPAPAVRAPSPKPAPAVTTPQRLSAPAATPAKATPKAAGSDDDWETF